MIELDGAIHRMPRMVKGFALAILLTLTLGYSVGMRYLYITSDFDTQGVEENYLGNEEDEEAEEMKFKMPEAKLLAVIHSHLISYALIFSIMGALLLISGVSPRLKRILLIEPFIFSILTFGGLYMLWCGATWISPILMISGIILSIGFYLSVILLTLDFMKNKG